MTFNEYLRTSVLENTCFLKFYFWFILTSEAAVRGFSPKLLFLKISQYSQENTYIYINVNQLNQPKNIAQFHVVSQRNASFYAANFFGRLLRKEIFQMESP